MKSESVAWRLAFELWWRLYPIHKLFTLNADRAGLTQAHSLEFGMHPKIRPLNPPPPRTAEQRMGEA